MKRRRPATNDGVTSGRKRADLTEQEDLRWHNEQISLKKTLK
jgi:hypothetical protein